MEKTLIVIGDVHGCLQELDELLLKLEYNKEKHRLVFLGDLMDRGPDPVGCVRRVRELEAEMVMGNHENLHLRWRGHETVRELTGKKNPMKAMKAADMAASRNLSEEDLDWMERLPFKIDLGLSWYAVHGGMEPARKINTQNAAQIMRVRYVNEKGYGVSLGADLSAPEGTVYWDQMWKGPESIIYGHCVHDLQMTRCTYYNNVSCIGMDTGCVFGGHLSAAIMHKGLVMLDKITPIYETFKPEIVQVKAPKRYYNLNESSQVIDQ